LGLSAGSEYAYLITDANEILQEVVFEDEYDFEGTDENEQRVYGLHYSGTLNEEIGSDRMETTASDCFEHSDSGDFISVTKNACNVCIVSGVDNATGSNTLDICPSDGTDDVVTFENTLGLAAGAEYAYLITDANQILQEVVYTDSYNFEGSDPNEQRVYGVHYFGTLNEEIGSNRLQTTASDCFEHSNNNDYITITKNACPTCIESEVSTTSGENIVDICPDDNMSDLISFQNTLGITNSNEYVYLITDANEILQEVVFANSFDFEGSSFEEQRVYGLHYEGTLNEAIGSIRTATTATACYEHSSASNYITITKNACIVFECFASGTTSSQGNVIDICPIDGLDDNLTLENTLNVDAGINYAYLLTDANEILQEVIFNNTYNFEGSDLNEQRIYGVHYDGDLNAQIGQNRLMTTASGCFEHSIATQFLTVTKNACPPVFECLASNVLSANGLDFSLCATDGISDLVNFSNSINATSGDHYAYLITSEDDILLDFTFNSSYDFENTTESTVRVHGVHFDGVLTPQLGQDRMLTTASECFQHSTGFVSIVTDDCIIPVMCVTSITSIAGGTSSIDICPTDNMDDVISLTNNLPADAEANYAYLITDVNEIVQAVANGADYNFEGSGLETQRVYGIHYDGSLNAMIGQNRLLTTATGCFAHSDANNFITVTKEACPPPPYECETTITATTDWSAMVDICPNDGLDNIVELKNNLSIETGDHYAFLITDAQEILQEVVFQNAYNFEGTTLDEQRVYGINFDGMLMPMIGVNRKMTTATACYAHSADDSFLTVTKNACIPEYECRESVTATTDWVSEIDICTSDAVDDIIELRNNLSIDAGDHYAYLITDAQEIVQEVVFTNTYNFEGTGVEEQRVYGINFDGTLTPMIGENRSLTTATGCYEHSGDLFLTITKNACIQPFECKESVTATTDWVTEVDVCANDSEDDFVELRNNINAEVGQHYAYLLTDEFENLQEVILDTVYNFENTGLEEQRVYGISYAGDLLPQIGEHRSNTSASECFIHSGDNLFIRINKTGSCITSTTDLSLADEINIFPIPSSGVVNVDFENSSVEFKTISLYDYTGNLIQSLAITSGREELFINTAGLYLIKFENEDVSTVKRIIVQ